MDGTYRTNKNGYPLVLVGTIDRHYHGHTLAAAICNDESLRNFEFILNVLRLNLRQLFDYELKLKYGLADGSLSIRGAFKKLFSGIQLIMCEYHLMFNVNKMFSKKYFL